MTAVSIDLGSRSYCSWPCPGVQTYTNPRLHVADDAARLSNKIRSDLPGAQKEAKTGIKLSAEEAGQKFDAAVSSIVILSSVPVVGDIFRLIREFTGATRQRNH